MNKNVKSFFLEFLTKAKEVKKYKVRVLEPVAIRAEWTFNECKRHRNAF